MHVRGSPRLRRHAALCRAGSVCRFETHEGRRCYSLGVLLFHLVTNRYPVEGPDARRSRRPIASGPAPISRDIRPDLPDEFISVDERALDPDPRQRFMSAGAFENALARFLGAPVENAIDVAAPGVLALRSPRRLRSSQSSPACRATCWQHGRARSPATEASVVVLTTCRSSDCGRCELQHRRRLVSDLGCGRSETSAGRSCRAGRSAGAAGPGVAPARIYVVNEDDRGVALLFPLPDQTVANPITQDGR